MTFVVRHNVEFTLYETGDVGAKMTCFDVNAPCHYQCPEGCEEWSFDLEQGSPVHYVSDHGTVYHRLVYYPRQCNAVEYFSNGDFGETYAGKDHPMVSGPVEVRYDRGYESYVWRYSDDGQEWRSS